MFLTTPTVKELTRLDMEELLRMLVDQTAIHDRMLKEAGSSRDTTAMRDVIERIQKAIAQKKRSEGYYGQAKN